LINLICRFHLTVFAIIPSKITNVKEKFGAGKVVAEGHFGTAYNYIYSSVKPVISADGTKHDGSYGYYARGPNVLYGSDGDTLFHRTYLPDGTRLVTWYDPDMA